MVKPHSSPKPAERPDRSVPTDALDDGYDPWDGYEGVDLTPTTLDSLVTWDVSGHARRDQERIRSAASRFPSETPGGQ